MSLISCKNYEVEEKNTKLTQKNIGKPLTFKKKSKKFRPAVLEKQLGTIKLFFLNNFDASCQCRSVVLRYNHYG